MSKLNRIQNEIKQLEGGRFQNLCDVYLYRKLDWENIVSLGSMEGTDKTTKGIPDTYFYNSQSEKYILVMYGTRKDSTNKLEIDIREAIEKTKTDKKNIQEIICCHTSSNITVKKDQELRNLAAPIKLTLIGIDTLAQDLLQFKYQDIVKDFLGIVESTEQVWNINQFISIHDSSKINAPLNISYIGENNNLDSLLEELNTHQILLLSGVPGTGKTRLAIELCKKLPSDSNVICVKSNGLSAYQDIKDALANNKINYLFLDDANTITSFDAITSLLKLEHYAQKIKLIITVRDYALSTISNQLKPFSLKIEKVLPMSDEQIELLINSITKVSSRNIRKIMKLSHNNPRIAVIAAIMVKEKKYDFIESGKDILDSYYGDIIQENKLSKNERIALFILSFRNKINLTNSDLLGELLIFFKLDSDTFIKSLNELHDKELCDIYQDKAAKVSDQSLSDFIIIDFIANKQTFKIREFFKCLFPKYEKEIVEMLVRVNTFKVSDDWINYLTKEIKFVYNEIIDTDNKELFLKQYGVIIPIEGLAFIHKKIKLTDSVDYLVTQIEFEEKKKNSRIADPIIDIICTLANSEKYKDAGILLLEYFNKRKDKIYEVYFAIKLSFNFEDDWNHYFQKKFYIFELFLEKDTISKEMAFLIANVAEEFLKFSAEKVTSNGRGGFFNRYTFNDGDYLIQLHSKIFDMLARVYGTNYLEVNNYIDKLLLNYPIYQVKNDFFKTVSSDLVAIENHFFIDLNTLSLREEAIVSKLSLEAKRLNLDPQPFLNYKPSNKQIIYNIFRTSLGDYRKSNLKVESYQEYRLAKLRTILDEYANDLSWVFNTLAKYQSDELLNNNELQQSVFLLYTNSNIEEQKQILVALLNSDFNIENYHYDCFMEKLSFKEGKSLFKLIDKEIDDRWILSNLLTSEFVDNEMIEELILFLNNSEKSKKISSFNILSFDTYIKLNNSILDILLNKFLNNEISEGFFIPNFVFEDDGNKILEIMGYENIKQMYIDCFDKRNIDDSGEIFKCLLKENDDDFIYQFLKKLNTERLQSNFIDCSMQIEYIWESSVAEDGLKKYLDYLIQKNRLIFVGLDPYLENVFKANINRSAEFIKEEVRETDDENKIINLFNISLEVFNDEILLDLFRLLKEKDIDSSVFEKMHLNMRASSWSGSLVPILDEEIIFLEKLLDIFEGVKYIEHSLIITQRVDSLKKQKENELLSDYLE